MNDDVIPVHLEEWERQQREQHRRRLNAVAERIRKQKAERIAVSINAARQSREPITSPEITSQNVALKKDLDVTKNELDSLKIFHNKLQSQLNELKTDLDTSNKLRNALEKQLQYVQHSNSEMYLMYISSIQQIVDLIAKRTNENKNNPTENNITFEPSTELIDSVFKILDSMLKTQTKWEPLYPDVKHLHKQNLDNSRVNNDQ